MNMKENWQAVCGENKAKTWTEVKEQITSLSDAEKAGITCEVCNDPTKYIFALWDGPSKRTFYLKGMNRFKTPIV